jgi:O-Antigen ligase
VSSLREYVTRDSAGAIVLALAIPVLFLHERYQPTLALDWRSTTIDIRLSDFLVLAVVVAAVLAAVRLGTGPLRAGWILWLPGIALIVWLAFEALRPVSIDDARFEDHLVSFLKLGEYALLVPAVPLLVRRTRDLEIVVAALVLWSAVATTVALVQFFGVDVFEAWNPGWRQPSFLGHHDLAALSALVAGLVVAAILCERRHASPGIFALALAAGALGLIVAGSLAAAGGFAVGVLVGALVARRRFAPSRPRIVALVALVAIVGAGVIAIRADSLEEFVRFLGISERRDPEGVETYSQRTVLAYIGLRIWEDNPVIGVGWQRSARAEVFRPYLADARERFPDVVDLAFPAPGREWGVQNLYVQMLADAGVIGFLLLLAVGVAGLVLARRTAIHAPRPWAAATGIATICALLTLAGEWGSLGIVAGIPIQAATCLALGLAAAGAATVEARAASDRDTLART